MKRTLPALIFSILFLVTLFFVNTKTVRASGEYLVCQPNSGCELGEFLYDDNSTPIVDAVCTLTSRNPDGTVFLNSVGLKPHSDGWYSYTASVSGTVGIYRSQICCNAKSDYLCLDKTFQIKPWSDNNSTSNNPWRMLDKISNFISTQISEIWNYSNKSFNNLGQKVSPSDQSEVKIQETNTTQPKFQDLIILSNDQKNSLDKIANEPLFKSQTANNQAALRAKLEKTKGIANRLYTSIQELKSRAELLDLKWNELPLSDIQNELDTINKIIKEDKNVENSSILASTEWLKNSWNGTISLNLSDQAITAQSQIENILSDLNLFGKTNNSITFKSALTHIQKLNNLIGTAISDANDPTLFGYYKKIDAQADTLNQEVISLKTLLQKSASLSKTELEKSLSEISNKVIESNQIPFAKVILDSPLKSTQFQGHNKILSLLALVNTNINLLNANTGQIPSQMWLENGSVVFRATYTNPSKSISQKVPVQIDLPLEIKTNQVISSSPSLKITNNSDNNRLSATGEFELGPSETRTFFVEVEDIWKYSEADIEKIKSQVGQLSTRFQSSALSETAKTFEREINSILDKALVIQKSTINPEERINNYYQTRLDLASLGQKTEVKNLLASADGINNSASSLPWGLQSIAIWGMVLALVAGAIFLVLYIKSLHFEPISSARDAGKSISNFAVTNQRVAHLPHKHPAPPHRHAHFLATLLTATILTSGFGSVLASYFIKHSQQVALISPLDPLQRPRILGASVSTVRTGVLKSSTSGSSINIYSQPSKEGMQIGSTSSNRKVFIFQETSDWVQIGISAKDIDKSWWVEKSYLN